jgi:hypothetical protein
MLLVGEDATVIEIGIPIDAVNSSGLGLDSSQLQLSPPAMRSDLEHGFGLDTHKAEFQTRWLARNKHSSERAPGAWRATSSRMVATWSQLFLVHQRDHRLAGIIGAGTRRSMSSRWEMVGKVRGGRSMAHLPTLLVSLLARLFVQPARKRSKLT